MTLKINWEKRLAHLTRFTGVSLSGIKESSLQTLAWHKCIAIGTDKTKMSKLRPYLKLKQFSLKFLKAAQFS